MKNDIIHFIIAFVASMTGFKLGRLSRKYKKFEDIKGNKNDWIIP